MDLALSGTFFVFTMKIVIFANIFKVKHAAPKEISDRGRA